MATAAKNTFFYGLGSAIRALSSFILLPIYANVLGASQYGVLNLLQTFTAIVAPLMSLTVEKSIYRLYFDYKSDSDKKEFLSTIFWSINATGFIVIVICIIFSGYLSNLLGGVDVKTVFYPVVIYTFFSALVTYCQIILQTQQKGLAFFIVSMILLIVYNIIALFLLFYWSPTYKSEVFGSLFACFVAMLVGLSFVRNQIRLKFNVSILKQILKYSAPLFFVSLFSWILSASDRFFIANFKTTTEVGLYSMAFKMTSMAVLLGASIKQAYDPYFYTISNSEKMNEAKIKLKPINDTMIFLSSLLFIFVVLFGNLFVSVYLAVEYQSSITYLYFLSFACLFTQQTNVLNSMILQNKKTIIISFITISSGIFSILLNFLLIPRFGSIMAAVDSLIVGVYMFCITWYFAKKNYYINIHFGNIWGAVVLILLCSFVDFSSINVFWGMGLKFTILAIGFYIFSKFGIFLFPTLKPVISRYIVNIKNKCRRSKDVSLHTK